jgi:hypothetical protein
MCSKVTKPPPTCFPPVVNSVASTISPCGSSLVASTVPFAYAIGALPPRHLTPVTFAMLAGPDTTTGDWCFLITRTSKRTKASTTVTKMITWLRRNRRPRPTLGGVAGLKRRPLVVGSAVIPTGLITAASEDRFRESCSRVYLSCLDNGQQCPAGPACAKSRCRLANPVATRSVCPTASARDIRRIAAGRSYSP